MSTRPSRLRRVGLFVAVAAMVTVTGCPRSSGQDDFGTLPSITTSNPEAEADLRAARDAAEAGQVDDAERGYRTFLERHPRDPLVPVARLGLGRVLLANGDVEAALALFAEVATSDDERAAEAGRFYQGVALHLSRRHAEALALLEPLVGRTTDPDETVLLLRTLAAAAQQEQRTVLALEALDRLGAAEEIGEADRSAAREDLRRVVAESDAAAIEEAYDALPRDGAAWPEVAMRAIRLAFDAGDMARVSAIVTELRQRQIPMSEELAELAVRAERTERADPRVIGAIVPLTGRGREVGQRTVRGLMLASGAPTQGPPAPDAPQLVLRDDGGDPERAARAVEDLVSEHRAIAIVGPLEGAAARAAAQRAQELGVPILTLVPDPRVTDPGPMAFRLLTSPQGEVTALVAAARRRGATRFAVLRPDHAYGRAMSEAYAEAVRAAGGELVADERYPANATAFGEVVGRIAERRFDALFVPDAARQLSLIAPALAAAGLWSTPAGQAAPRGGRAITLMAPSVAIDDRAAAGASRYLQGALFATPFHAATATGPGRAFVDAFTARFDQAPDAYAAQAYDAFQLIRAAVVAGETTRAGVAEWLTTQGRRETVSASGGLGPSRTPARPARVITFSGDAFAPASAPSS
ncbi:MAG: penicillin-binding protein activator [Myxococcota bacterium]|nr:penicillin-binding protein activator [Myxococcota bacterium]